LKSALLSILQCKISRTICIRKTSKTVFPVELAISGAHAMTTKSKPAADAAESMAALGKETFESVLSMSAQATAEGYKNAAQFGKEQLEATKAGYEKLASFGKGNLEAYSQASAAALSGMESFYEEWVG